MRDRDGIPSQSGPFAQVSRLGNPLFNEVLVPMESKDYWNAASAGGRPAVRQRGRVPELAKLLPALYPGVFPNLAALERVEEAARPTCSRSSSPGSPPVSIPGFQNFTGPTQADMLRLNVAIPPKPNRPSNLGLLGGDIAGYPNGRRVFDDVFTIELRAIAGVTYALVDKTFTPDGAAAAVTDGLTTNEFDQTAEGTVKYLPSFPYLGNPHSGYEIPALADASR